MKVLIMISVLRCFQHQIIGEFFFFSFGFFFIFFEFFFSDQVGNRGAFITLKGKDMIPAYTTYEAVVSFFLFNYFKHNIILRAEKWSNNPRAELNEEKFN